MAETNGATLPAVPTRPKLTDQQICTQARGRLKVVEDWERAFRPLARADLRFSLGDQWPDGDRNAREAGPNPRPCLVINRLEEMILQVVNEFRMQRPGIVVRPVGDGTDIATAEIVQGIVRQIERTSDADIAYENGVDHSTRMGRGWWRIVLEFDSPMSFDLTPHIRRMRNAFAVYLDPMAQEPDGSDATYGFVVQEMSKDEFERTYPDAEPLDFPLLASNPDYAGWITRDTVRVAEYFFLEWTDETLALMADGTTRLAREVTDKTLIVETRQTQIAQQWQVKLTGIEVLETFKWPGRFIPLVPVLGTEEEVDGQLHLKGITRNAVDPQRMINYWASIETELIAMTPKAPWIGPEGFREGHEIAWRDANTRNLPALEYHPTLGPDGRTNPPPQRQSVEPPVQAITQQRMLAMDDLRGTTGVHPPALGEVSPDTSGAAIRQRQQRSDVGNVHYSANAARSVRQTGKILVDMIPRIMNRKRVIRILGIDGEEEIVTINAAFDRDGVEALFPVGEGEFDVAIESGPSLSTRRQEAAEGLVRLTQAYPDLMKILGDITVRNMDMPDSQEAAERIRRTIPPEVLGTDEEPSPEQLQAMVRQLTQQLKQLNAFAMAREEEVSSLEEEKRILALKNEDKSQENAIKLGQLELDREELQLKAQTDNRKLDIEEQTKNRDLDLDAAKLAVEVAEDE